MVCLRLFQPSKFTTYIFFPYRIWPVRQIVLRWYWEISTTASSLKSLFSNPASGLLQAQYYSIETYCKLPRGKETHMQNNRGSVIVWYKLLLRQVSDPQNDVRRIPELPMWTTWKHRIVLAPCRLLKAFVGDADHNEAVLRNCPVAHCYRFARFLNIRVSSHLIIAQTVSDLCMFIT